MMDFNDIFRRLFGFQGPSYRGGNETTDDGDIHEGTGPGPGGFGFFMHPPGRGGMRPGVAPGSTENEDEEGVGASGGFPNEGFPFTFDHDVNQMFRHFEEMFRNFGLADFPPLDVPSIPPPPSGEADSGSPRDQMLKEPDTNGELGSRPPTSTPLPKEPSSWFDNLRRDRSPLFNPSHLDSNPSSKKEDSDLDDVVRQGELDRIFGSGSKDAPGARQQQPQIRTFSRSVSIQTIRRPDGTVETRRTEQDGKGNTTTTVTTRGGDPSHPLGPGPLGHPGMLPGPRGFAGPLEREPMDDPLFSKFFGSWFKK